MRALMGFSPTTGEYVFAVASSNVDYLAQKRKQYAGRLFAELAELPRHPAWHKLVEGVVVKVDDYADLEAAWLLEQEAKAAAEAAAKAEAEAQALVAAEQEWVVAELNSADVEVRKHDDSHGRVTGTKPEWRAYRNALRDRVIDGEIQGDPTKAGRPVRPA